MPRLIASFATIACLAAAALTPAQAQPPARLAEVATGAVSGVYFPVGIALCRLPNQTRGVHGLRCAARPAEGSVGNIAALAAGETDLAIVQSDIEADAVAGAGVFAGRPPFATLRALMSLHAEPLVIVARTDSGIRSLGDLAGRRVALGPEGSGTRDLAAALVTALGWPRAEVAAAPALPVEALGTALCAGEIDAFAYAVGQPALAIQETANACDVRLVPVEGPAAATLLSARPALVATAIPGGLYRGTPGPTPSLGPVARLVARADLPDDVVGVLLAGIYDEFGMLTGLHPALGTLEARRSAAVGTAAPLHPAAAAFYASRRLEP